MTQIEEGTNMRWTYENLHVECPWCGQLNILNRTSDLGSFDPIDCRHVTCESPECSRAFHVGGDMVSPAYGMILFDCAELLKRKQFMYCVLNLAQAFEVFFSHYFRVEFIYKPFWADVRAEKDIGSTENLERLLYKRTKDLPFSDMKNLFICHLLYEDQPSSLVESESIIRRIPRKPSQYADENIKSAEKPSDRRLRELLLLLNACGVAELRNRVVHKLAFRPDENDVLEALRETREILFPLAYALRVHVADPNWYRKQP